MGGVRHGEARASAAVARSPIETEPAISVVIPVRNDPGALDRCLASLAEARYPEFEVIVVDDASTDETAAVAVRHGARLIRLPDRVGPGAARNRGASEASYEILFFLDADVTVEPDTLEKVAETFWRNPEAIAVFGSYDRAPAAANVLSQYRNLLHHYIHQTSREEATTFWSGCGAILRSAFLESGGFDPAYDRPSVEDIDLGVRLRRAGQRIVLNKGLQVKHLKRWSLWSIVRCDFWQRGVPWTLLIHREGSLPDDLNLKRSHRVAGVLSLGLLLSLALGALYFSSLALVPLAIAAVVVAIDRYTHDRRLPDGAILFAVLATAGLLGAVFYETAVAHHSMRLWLLGCTALAAGIVVLNFDFYRFCARLKGPGFAALVLPLHILYFGYATLAFSFGTLLHLWRGNDVEAVATAAAPDAEPAAAPADLRLAMPARRVS